MHLTTEEEENPLSPCTVSNESHVYADKHPLTAIVIQGLHMSFGIFENRQVLQVRVAIEAFDQRHR